MAAKKQEQHPVGPVLRVAPLGELRVYTVTEEELEAIGRGSLGSIFLNFALALLPLSGGFLITLLTTKIEALGTLVFFTSACIVCFIAGVLFAVLAWHYHSSTVTVIEKIKNRMPPPPSEPATPEVPRVAPALVVAQTAEAPATSGTTAPGQPARTTPPDTSAPPGGAPPSAAGPPGPQSGEA